MARAAVQRGFTLLEMMVVLILIGIVMGMAMLSFGGTGPQDRLEEEARRLMQLVGLAREEAILQVEDIALEVERTGYRFSRLREVEPSDPSQSQSQFGPPGSTSAGGALATDTSLRWQAIENDSLLRRRELQDGQSIALSASAEPLPGIDSADAEVPRIHLSPSGEISPFELILRDGDAELRVIGEPDGRLHIEGDEQP